MRTFCYLYSLLERDPCSLLHVMQEWLTYTWASSLSFPARMVSLSCIDFAASSWKSINLERENGLWMCLWIRLWIRLWTLLWTLLWIHLKIHPKIHLKIHWEHCLKSPKYRQLKLCFCCVSLLPFPLRTVIQLGWKGIKEWWKKRGFRIMCQDNNGSNGSTK